MDYYYENDFKIYKLKGKIHEKIILYHVNFKKHIKIKHPEMTLEKIKNILKDPDHVFKPSNNSDDSYYEKKFDKDTYRVVINKYQKHVKAVVTAYKVNKKEAFSKKHVHCVYDPEIDKDYEMKIKELEDDQAYFYEIFGIAK